LELLRRGAASLENPVISRTRYRQWLLPFARRRR